MFQVSIMVEVGLKFQKTERLLAIVSNIKVRVLQTENIDIKSQGFSGKQRRLLIQSKYQRKNNIVDC